MSWQLLDEFVVLGKLSEDNSNGRHDTTGFSGVVSRER